MIIIILKITIYLPNKVQIALLQNEKAFITII